MTACRSGRWPTRCCQRETRRTSTAFARSASRLSPTQAGAPVFPNILTQVVPTVTLVNFTTMDRDLENAYSRQASLEVEHQIGRTATVSVGYHYLRGMKLIMSVNQNVPTCVASGNNNGCRPNPNYANNSQYSAAGTSEYDGLHVSFQQRPAAWGSYRVSYTYSKSMNNMGEAFFSSPIDPLDISKDWGRSDDDQRHRLAVHASVNTSMAPATTAWERLSHGFTVSGVVQYYSALPYNITSGVTTIQGTPGRPIVDGEFIERNAGEGSPFSTVSLRITRVFRVSRVRIEALAEAFNLLEPPQRHRPQYGLRARRVPDQSESVVRHRDGRRRATRHAIWGEGQVLRQGRGKRQENDDDRF